MRILLIIALFVVGLPLVTMAALQLYGTSILTQTFAIVHDMSKQVEEKKRIETADSYYEKEHNFVIVRENSSYFELAHALFIDWDEFSQYQIISVTLTVPYNTLIKNEESIPDKEFAEMAADARSVNVMLEECELIKQAFADNCKVTKVSAKIIEDDRVRISAKLSFTYPAIVPQNNSPEPVKYAFNTAEAKMTGDQGEITSNISNSQSVRKKIYANAAKYCETFAKKQGSCSIGGLSMAQSAKRGSQNSTVTKSVGAFGYLTELK